MARKEGEHKTPRQAGGGVRSLHQSYVDRVLGIPREKTGESALRGSLAAAAMAFLMALTAACSTQPAQPTPSPTPENASPGDERFTVATVVNVIDGVTIDVDINGEVSRVRYLGIEIPEVGADGVGEQFLGEGAFQFNRFTVEGQVVELERDIVDTDEFGRLLRYVYVNGEMVNKSLLTAGYATVAGSPSDFGYLPSFALAQEAAKDDRRGYWKSAPHDFVEGVPSPTPEAVQPFTGGTLPLPPGMEGRSTACDYSSTAESVIKGSVESRTGERVYHVPGGLFYSTTVVTESEGDRWFCTEAEAIAAGWERAKH